MSSKTKKPTAPKWFKGMIYTKGETVTNPFSGESYDLTGLETSIYDFIIGCQMVFENSPSTMTKKRINEFQKALNWFRVNNPQAYYVLLDQQQFSYPRQRVRCVQFTVLTHLASSYSKGTGFSWYNILQTKYEH